MSKHLEENCAIVRGHFYIITCGIHETTCLGRFSKHADIRQ